MEATIQIDMAKMNAQGICERLGHALKAWTIWEEDDVVILSNKCRHCHAWVQCHTHGPTKIDGTATEIKCS